MPVLDRYLPRSLFGRMALVLLGSILLAEVFLVLVWREQAASRDERLLREGTQSLALSLASTARFFTALPSEYRHLTLNQLRSMGGTRFFVSLNRQFLAMDDLADFERRQLVQSTVLNTLREQLGSEPQIHVNFTSQDGLRILNPDTRLRDLPPSWVEYSLTLEPLDPPILVTQIRLKDDEWLYLAAAMPMPLWPLETAYLPARERWLLALMTLLLLLTSIALARSLTRPLKQLARHARKLGQEIEQPPLSEDGPREIQEAARALNAMQRQVQRYVKDRAQTFSSISHDLKTPITRLRLRVELIEEEAQREALLRNLDELELLVKGALQCMKDTDIHENTEAVDLSGLLKSIQSELPDPSRLTLRCLAQGVYPGKPFALKRCLTNLIDNGIKYGECVHITLLEGQTGLHLSLRDEGPGIPQTYRDQVFEPYFRLPASRSKPGDGLGLGIARQIIHAHGGTLSLSNYSGGGLLIQIELPR
ncbi:ATP-binding protein [Atopomonas sediminilitoris]|uniref:ATP-binding protein n=1 Tax=Atopomonas sediminilitoris TaxID=2919919 RepID=UPI001F4E3D62|nr:ATP-binding protein [Atopomonas sediminilitoris]MCJ8168753.1 ATP-binding protein [Atopomonas sediminilitoris]